MRSFTAGLGKSYFGSWRTQYLMVAPVGQPSDVGTNYNTTQPHCIPSDRGAKKPTSGMNYYPNRQTEIASHYAIVVIGTSLGGLRALQVLLAGLPKDFPLSVAIAQHRHRNSDETLSLFLQQHCALPVTEAEDKETILPGRVYLAPADYHLLVEGARFALSTEAPVCYARPSIDVLFESAAEAYGEKAIGAILTGASSDGSQGLLQIKRRGGLAVVQEPTTAEAKTMPNAAIAAVSVDWIVPLGEIAPLIVQLCNRAVR